MKKKYKRKVKRRYAGNRLGFEFEGEEAEGCAQKIRFVLNY